MLDFPGLTLLAPLFLLLAGLALLIVLLHQRHGRRELSVSSLILWQRLQAVPEGAAMSRHLPKLDLLLILQIAVVVLAALALARPLLGPDAGRPVHRIYVLDASGSMRATDGPGTRFAAAEAKLAQLLAADVDRDGPRVSVVLAGPVPRVLLARQRDDHDLLAGVALQPSDGGADWAVVQRLVASLGRDGETQQVFVLTDGADVGAATLGGTEIRIGRALPDASLGSVRLVAVEGNTPNRFRLSGSATFSGGAGSAALAVDYRIADAPQPLQLAATTVTANADGAPASFDVDLTLPGAGIVTARLGPDGQAGDDAARFVVAEAPTARSILVLGPAQPPLLRALSALDGAVVTAVEALPADLSGVALVVIDDVAVDAAPATNALWVGRARVRGEAEPPAVEPGDVTDWRPEHPLSRGIVWNSLRLTRASRIASWPDATPLVVAGDTVLIAARSTPHGREVRIAFDPARDWAGETSFPQFLDNLYDWLGPLASGRVQRACSVGAPCALDARWYGTDLTRVGDDGAADEAIALPGPGGSFVPERAGLYRHGNAVLAVNADAHETATPLAPAAGGPQPQLPQTLWPWLLGAAVLALALEAIVSLRRKVAPRWFWALRGLVFLLALAALLNLRGPAWTASEELVLVADGTAHPPLGGAALVHSGETLGVAADFGGAVAPAGGGATGSTADALRLAAALLPAGQGGRIVLAAPGTLGDVELAGLAPELKARGVIVDATAPPALPAGEIAVVDVAAPQAVFTADSFVLTGRVRAAADGPAHLTVSEDGVEIAAEDIDLVAGDNPVEITVPKAKAGDALYEMAVRAPGDTIAQNNANAAHVTGLPAPQILILSQNRTAGQALADDLAAGGLLPKLLIPTQAPWLIEDWLKYDGYVLLDVPALTLNTTQQELIGDAVAQHGRPLLLMGGPHSFGPGGYLETPLDRLSPLSSRVPKPSPEAAVVFVIDRSGSMAQAVGDVDRLEIAKQATLSAIGLLNPLSRVAIVVFDTEARLLAPLQPATELDSIRTALARLGPGGGTELQPALSVALDQLRDVVAPVKHVIALTDGLTPPTDFSALLDAMGAADITLSTIAIGTDTNDRVLRRLAEAGGGTFHGSKDFKALPSIMTQETMLMSDSAVEERSVVPRFAETRSDFLSTLPAALPPVEGYVLTTGKPEATVDLTVETADGGESPLLGTWQYGSGRVLALTTEAQGTWTRNWDALPAYRNLWGEVLRHFITGADGSGLGLYLSRRGDGVVVTATALDAKRLPRQHLALSATVTPPGDGAAPQVLRLAEMQPGHYEGHFAFGDTGDYRVTVSEGDDTETAAIRYAYPTRLAFDADTGRAALAAATGGRMLEDGAAPLPPTGAGTLTLRPNWVFWALCAVAAFTLELLLRYGGGLFRRGGRGPARQSVYLRDAHDNRPVAGQDAPRTRAPA